MRTLSQSAAGWSAREAMGLASDAPSREGSAVEHDGFNLHASVRIAAEDDSGREWLCRYGARPPFSLERLRLLPGGRMAYRIKKLGAGRAKHRVMTPIELLARLAALVPPPRYPLVRYHGVLAPHAAWRREVVPGPPIASGTVTVTAGAEGKKRPCGPSTRRDAAPTHGGASSRPAGHAGHDREPSSRPAGHSGRDLEPSRRPAVAGGTDAVPGAVAECDRARLTCDGHGGNAFVEVTTLAPNILSVRHWSRVLGGLLYATSPRLPWAQLLQRTFDVDILECPQCKGRLRLIETVVEKGAARQILERLGLPVDAPQLVRARDPTTLDGDEPDAA
ncbi:MAG: transposase [Myxococcales bacterium]|nr:transposase [Myxococcales bacterium]